MADIGHGELDDLHDAVASHISSEDEVDDETEVGVRDLNGCTGDPGGGTGGFTDAGKD